MQASTETDDGADDQVRLLGRSHLAHEALIDLEFGEWQSVQLHQGRLARAEIVDRQLEALQADAGQDFQHQLGIGHGSGFGQFQA